MEPSYFQITLLCLLWCTFYILHSISASANFKRYLKLFFPKFFAYYRLFYNFFALLTWIPALYYYISIPSPLLFSKNYAFVLYPGYALMILGVMVMIAAFRNYPIREFIGISYVRDSTTVSNQLAVNGLNAWVRHPLYFGIILFLAGYLASHFNLKTLIVTLITFAYLLVGTYLEEQKLIKEFGTIYLEYCKRVKMFIPRIF